MRATAASLLLPRCAALALARRSPVSRRALAEGAAAGLSMAAAPAAAAATSRPVNYDAATVTLSGGARVPVAVWTPGGDGDGSPATYGYRISAGRLVKTMLGLPLPDGLAKSWDLPAAAGVVDAKGAAPAGAPAVLLAHGFLGSRFDLAPFGEALVRELRVSFRARRARGIAAAPRAPRGHSAGDRSRRRRGALYSRPRRRPRAPSSSLPISTRR